MVIGVPVMLQLKKKKNTTSIKASKERLATGQVDIDKLYILFRLNMVMVLQLLRLLL